jgi:hypothetical protein
MSDHSLFTPKKKGEPLPLRHEPRNDSARRAGEYWLVRRPTCSSPQVHLQALVGLAEEFRDGEAG